MQYFNIQVASQLSGVASATIRAWEKRYNAVVPERADNKHRLYSEKDIEKLALLCKLTEFGQSIGKIAHLGLEELKQVYTTLLHKPYDEKDVVTPHHERVDYEKVLNSFLMALAAYKIDIITHELSKALQTMSPRDFCLNLIVPLFHEIGKKIDRGELSIAQEHTLSALVSFHMGQMIGLHYQKQPLRSELILITTPEGEQHQIGILAAALLCVQYGFRIIFMGVSLPHHSLAEAANGLKCHAVLLGVTHSFEKPGVPPVESYVSELAASLTQNSLIWVGGNVKPSLRTELEKRRIPYFDNLLSFDEFLADY